MTSHEFIEDGIRYVPSRIAAKSTDLTPDYISRMCREGRVLATWHRGAWYVNETSLATVLAERRRKQEQLARAQSEEFKRVLGPANAAETSVVTRDTAAHVRRSRAPFVALTITLLIATSVFAPPQTVRENLAAQLPFRIPSALTELPQLPTNTGSQLAAAATSFPNFIKEKIQSVFCWWLECKTTTVEIAQQRPRPSTSTNIVPPITAAKSTRVVSNTPTQISVTPQPPQTVNQPIIERVRETVRTIVAGGIDAAFVDARLAALNTDLTNRMTSLSSENSSQTTNVYNTVSAALRIENLDDVNITGSRWTGGSITGATITGGSVAATTFSGVLDISTGGTGTSSAPTYGRVLLGNASGSYDLVATSSLGIVGTGSSGADFGKTFELGSGALSPTTTVGLIIAASSTFNGGLSIDRSTTTSATSTNLFATLGRFTSGIIDALTATAATITNLTANTLVATNATSTRIDALDYVAVGRTATTTIRGDGVASTIPYASSTAITVSGTASTSNLVASNSFTLANLSGILKATAGAVASAFVDLASDVIGILPVTNGGTGWASLASAAIPYGNGAGALATTTVGTPGQILALLNGVPTWTASSTLSTITGTLGVSQGGTGLSSFTYGLLLSPGGTTALTNIATSSLGLLTTNIAEGSNLYYLDSRVQSFVHGSSTIPKTYTSNTYTGANTFTSTFTLTGLNGPLDARSGVVGATTSIGVLYGGTGLASAPTYGQMLVGNSSGGYTLTATSSLGLATFGYLFPSNATSTLLTFNGGLLSLASTTIGAGTQAGGLTVFGGATTTGALVVTGTSASSTFAGNVQIDGALKVGTGSIYLNGSATSTFSAGIQSSALNITSTTATSTFANGIRLSGGCFQMADGTCAGSGGGSGTINSGTTGQFPYYAGNGTTLTATSSLFLATTGNVGIGTTSPYVKLGVSGGNAVLNNAFIGDAGFGSSYTAFSHSSMATTGTYALLQENIGNTFLNAASGRGIYFRINNSDKMILDTSGNVGIGTTFPTQPLTVIGTTTLGSFGAGNDQARGLNVTSGNNTFAAPLSSGSYDPSILTRFVYGSVAQDYGVMPNGTTWVQNRSISDFAANYGYLINPNGGNVGIGTTSPTQILSLRAAGGAKLYLEDTNNAVNWTLGQTNTAPFSISQNGNTWLTIAHNTGNVGIGTTSPNAKLNVYSGAAGVAPNSAKDDLVIEGSGATGMSILVPNGQSAGIAFGSPSNALNWSIQSVDATSFEIYRLGVSKLIIDSNGNVGIGTTTPASLNGFSQVLSLGGIAPAITLRSTNSGGTVWEIGNDTSGNFRLIRDAAVSAVTVNTSGNLGLASTSPWRTLSVTGTAGFSSSLSAESGSDEVLCIDPATFEMTRGGASCAASSLRYKENIQNLDYDLDDVLAMRPVSFQWSLAERPNDRSTQVGFIAEEMDLVIPEVLEHDASGGPESIDYDKLTSILARAIQQIATITGTFKSNLIAWLADTSNGIANVFAKHLHAENITADFITATQDVMIGRYLCVKKSDGSDTCVTGDELSALLSQSPAPPLANPSPPETPAVHESATSTHGSATTSPQANTLLLEEPATSPEPVPPPRPEPNPATSSELLPPDTASGT